MVTFADGKLAGYLIGSIKKTESYRNVKKIAEIENMFVLPKFRGEGIGPSLCGRFVEWAKTKGVKIARVTASSKNEKAIAFYKKNGFSNYNLTLERDL